MHIYKEFKISQEHVQIFFSFSKFHYVELKVLGNH